MASRNNNKIGRGACIKQNDSMWAHFPESLRVEADKTIPEKPKIAVKATVKVTSKKDTVIKNINEGITGGFFSALTEEE
jgi:hypothetical protein